MEPITLIHGLRYDSVRELCRKIKTPPYLIDVPRTLIRSIPRRAALIPVPGHEGKATYTFELAISLRNYCNMWDNKDVEVFDILEGDPRESLCELKQQGKNPDKVKTTFRPNGSYQEEDISDRPLVLIDNVVDTGRTARAAQQALGRPCLLAVIGDTGRSGICTPLWSYAIVSLSSHDMTNLDDFLAVDNRINDGRYEQAMEYLLQWDYGGENLDSARVYDRLYPGPTDSREPSDKVLLTRDGYHLCFSDSYAYKAYYLTKDFPLINL